MEETEWQQVSFRFGRESGVASRSHSANVRAALAEIVHQTASDNKQGRDRRKQMAPSRSGEAEELGYEPNHAPKNQREGRSRNQSARRN